MANGQTTPAQIEHGRGIDLPGAQSILRCCHIEASIEIGFGQLLPLAQIPQQVILLYDFFDAKIDIGTASSLALDQLRPRQGCVLQRVPPGLGAGWKGDNHLPLLDGFNTTQSQFRFGQAVPALTRYDVQCVTFVAGEEDRRT